jgi:hypothetical protein
MQLLPRAVPLSLADRGRHRILLLRDDNLRRCHGYQLPDESDGSVRNGAGSVHLGLQVRSDMLSFDHPGHVDYDKRKRLHANAQQWGPDLRRL